MLVVYRRNRIRSIVKKRFEIYLGTEELQLIEHLKKDTGYKKPGMAITAAIHSYFRYQNTIKKLIAEKNQLENKLKEHE